MFNSEDRNIYCLDLCFMLKTMLLYFRTNTHENVSQTLLKAKNTRTFFANKPAVSFAVGIVLVKYTACSPKKLYPV